MLNDVSFDRGQQANQLGHDEALLGAGDLSAVVAHRARYPAVVGVQRMKWHRVTGPTGLDAFDDVIESQACMESDLLYARGPPQVRFEVIERL